MDIDDESLRGLAEELSNMLFSRDNDETPVKDAQYLKNRAQERKTGLAMAEDIAKNYLNAADAVRKAWHEALNKTEADNDSIIGKIKSAMIDNIPVESESYEDSGKDEINWDSIVDEIMNSSAPVESGSG
ncbi:MAG: hypothetical protein LBI42_01730 [Chitinispirillales bacterium]|jgi:hypothetical protein|nr:hypothetical protein [Chitinispirillales bacterium]